MQGAKVAQHRGTLEIALIQRRCPESFKSRLPHQSIHSQIAYLRGLRVFFFATKQGLFLACGLHILILTAAAFFGGSKGMLRAAPSCDLLSAMTWL